VSDLLDRFQSLLGDSGVLVGEAVSERTVGIWDQRAVTAKAILRPANTAQVSDVLKACNEAGQSVVVHGGLTGLVQGGVAEPADFVLSLERMNRIESVDVAERCLVAEAGVILQSAQEAAAEAGLLLPLDLGARGSCQLGGNVATNAGGNRVIRFGMTRDLLLGLEAVLADGTVLSSMNKMLKNNAGYDLKQLFVGTEGTLGVITKVVMKLQPAWQSQSTALVACESFADVTALLLRLQSELGGQLSAFECMWQGFYQCVSAGRKVPLTTDHPFYVLVESLGSDPEHDEARFIEVLESAIEANCIVDAAVAKSEAERESFWALRDSVDRCLEFGPGFIFDVSLPISDMEAYVEEVTAALDKRWPEHHSFAFGHVGDGNIHFVISVGAEEARTGVEQCVYEPLRTINGSVSAEHGIGLEKKAWLSVSRSAEEVAVMRQLKQALDPKGILNPGKVV